MTATANLSGAPDLLPGQGATLGAELGRDRIEFALAAPHAQAVEQHNRFGQSSGMEGGGHLEKNENVTQGHRYGMGPWPVQFVARRGRRL